MAAGLASPPTDGDVFGWCLTLSSLLAMVALVNGAANSPPTRELSPEETLAGIRKLWQAYSAHVNRTTALQVGAIYARYSSKFQNSILDQVRSNLEFAERQRIFVPLEFIFFDQAKSGRKNSRPGLDQLKNCLEQKKVQALLVFATSRLFRRTARALDFVDRVVKELGLRIVFVMNGIDSQNDVSWKRYLSFLALFDEFASEIYVEHIRASHIGKLMNRMVYGTLPFGYHGVDIPDSANRNGKPNRRIEIHPDHAAIVKLIFNWFVDECCSINLIIRRLNADPNVPPPPKGNSRQWTRLAVLKLLRNERYRGTWSYGNTESVLLSQKDYIRHTKRIEPLKTVQFEELRLISDLQFLAAQQKLQDLAQTANRGRRRQSGTAERLPKLLNGFFYCPAHDRSLHVGGPHGEYMVCPACQRESGADRVLFSQLNRQTALQKLCSELGRLIGNDAGLVEQVIVACKDTADSMQRPDPQRKDFLKLREQKLKRGLQALFKREVEAESESENDVVSVEIQTVRRELTQIALELAALENFPETEVTIPTADDVKAQLAELSGILTRIAADGPPEELDQVRELLRKLTGGRIELSQQGERSPRGGWLRGTFHAPLVKVIGECAAGVTIADECPGIDVVIDFDRPRGDAERIEEAWRLYNEGVMKKEIARRLNCSRSNVARMLKAASENHNVPFVDGRKRRATLREKQTTTPTYKTIGDAAVELWNQGKSFCEIGRQLECSDVMAEKAIRYWHESRDMPVPTAETRRQDQMELARRMQTAGASTSAIAKAIGVSTTSIRNWLR